MTKEITNKDNRQWFKDAKFGLMIHFGLYSLLAGEWKGRKW
jgi:alpha-L-fucosidase